MEFLQSFEGVDIFDEDSGTDFLIRADKKTIGNIAEKAQQLCLNITDIKNYLIAPNGYYDNCYKVNYYAVKTDKL